MFIKFIYRSLGLEQQIDAKMFKYVLKNLKTFGRDKREFKISKNYIFHCQGFIIIITIFQIFKMVSKSNKKFRLSYQINYFLFYNFIH